MTRARSRRPSSVHATLARARRSERLLAAFWEEAQEVHCIGLVNEVYAPEKLMDAALEIAEKIARNSPTAVQSMKHAAKSGLGEPLEQAIAIMMEAHWTSVVHPDRVEGIQAFSQRPHAERRGLARALMLTSPLALRQEPFGRSVEVPTLGWLLSPRLWKSGVQQ